MATTSTVPALADQVRATTPITAYTVTGEEEWRIAMLVRELFYRARDHRRPLIAQWKRNYQVLYNHPWSFQRADPPSGTIAKIWPGIASLVSWMTDQRPSFETTPSAIPFSPYSDFYAQLSADMTAALNAIFSEHLLDAEISKALWDVCTYSIGYFKVLWEPWQMDGIGDTVCRRIDPFMVYPDPFAREMSQLSYIIEAKIMTLDDLDRTYPGARDRVNVGYLESVDESPHRLDQSTSIVQPRASIGALAPATSATYSMRESDRLRGTTHSETPVVTVLECWVRSYHVIRPDPEASHSPDALPQVAETWKVIAVCGNAVLLNELAEDVSGFNTHPYDRLVLFDTGEWYGPCLVELLTAPQESINRILGAIEYNVTLMGNPMLVRDPMASARNRRITNRPGAQIEANPQQVSWMQPPQIHPQMSVTLIQYCESQIETILGLSAIVRGFAPSGRNAQGVLDAVQDAAFVRVRATLRELERTLKSVCKKMVSNIAEFYTEPRLLSLLGPDGQRTSLALRARHFYLPNADQGKRIPMRFNILADAGSGLLTSRQARAAQAMQLYAVGAIDVTELLKAIQWPNYTIVGRRVMELQAAQGTLGQPPGARQKSKRSS